MLTFLGNKIPLAETEVFKVLTDKKIRVHLKRSINISTNNNSILRYCFIPVRACIVHETKDNE